MPGSASRGCRFRELEWVFSSGGLAPGCHWRWVGSQDRATCAFVWHSAGGPQTSVVVSKICTRPLASDWKSGCPSHRCDQVESIQILFLSNILSNPSPARGPSLCMVSPTGNFLLGRPENHELEAERLM